MKTYHPDPRFADRCSRPVVLLVTETNLGGWIVTIIKPGFWSD
jgi:hypothetical protein